MTPAPWQAAPIWIKLQGVEGILTNAIGLQDMQKIAKRTISASATARAAIGVYQVATSANGRCAVLPVSHLPKSKQEVDLERRLQERRVDCA